MAPAERFDSFIKLLSVVAVKLAYRILVRCKMNERKVAFFF